LCTTDFDNIDNLETLEIRNQIYFSRLWLNVKNNYFEICA